MIPSKSVLFAACLLFAGCAGPKKKVTPTPVPAPAAPEAAVRPAGPPAPKLSSLKRSILALAQQEWDYFGRQVVVLDGEEESIPHVGKWEDDEEVYAVRVNWYWRAVGKPHLTGNHCRVPWSAAFISWIMREAGLSGDQFPPAEAHWMYLTHIMAVADQDPYAAFAPRTLTEYQPRPGDLLCATRGNGEAPLPGQDPRSVLLDHTQLHCDIVVERHGDTLAAIGGNVRNSVSKTLLKLDRDGFVQPTTRRPWFMALENRL